MRGTHVPRGGGYGVVGEALTGLWRVAEADDRLADLREPLASTGRVHRRAGDRGAADGTRRRRPRPDRCDGPGSSTTSRGWTTSSTPSSALLRTIAIVEAESVVGEDDALGWLWGALVATLNTLFAAVGVPRRESGRERATLGALGGLVGAVIVLVVALLGDPLLNLIDVSAPAARIAVGAVAAVAALFRMVARPPSPSRR